MQSEIISLLNKFITEEILKQPDHKISPQAALISGGIIDSFSLVDIAMFVEEQFGVRIDDNELNASVFDSLDDLATLISSRK